jgi:hypothetical protein
LKKGSGKFDIHVGCCKLAGDRPFCLVSVLSLLLLLLLLLNLHEDRVACKALGERGKRNNEASPERLSFLSG